MASLFDPTKTSTLEDVLGRQAQTQIAGLQDTGIQNRKRLVSKLAAEGKLMGGTADYPLADLATEQAGAESDVYSGLAGALGGIPAEDWSNSRQFQRDYELAKLIGSLNKPSKLSQALGGAASGAMMGAMTGNPWAALGGGVAGGVTGAYA